MISCRCSRKPQEEPSLFPSGLNSAQVQLKVGILSAEECGGKWRHFQQKCFRIKRQRAPCCLSFMMVVFEGVPRKCAPEPPSPSHILKNRRGQPDACLGVASLGGLPIKPGRGSLSTVSLRPRHCFQKWYDHCFSLGFALRRGRDSLG